jgi:hypothetical protein
VLLPLLIVLVWHHVYFSLFQEDFDVRTPYNCNSNCIVNQSIIIKTCLKWFIKFYYSLCKIDFVVSKWSGIFVKFAETKFL